MKVTYRGISKGIEEDDPEEIPDEEDLEGTSEEYPSIIVYSDEDYGGEDDEELEPTGLVDEHGMEILRVRLKRRIGFL